MSKLSESDWRFANEMRRVVPKSVRREIANMVDTALAKKLDRVWNSRRLQNKIIEFVFDQNHNEIDVAKSMAEKFRIPIEYAADLVNYTVESELHQLEQPEHFWLCLAPVRK